eukprot:1267641-Rhodomonas_salina.1
MLFVLQLPILAAAHHAHSSQAWKTSASLSGALTTDCSLQPTWSRCRTAGCGWTATTRTAGT